MKVHPMVSSLWLRTERQTDGRMDGQRQTYIPPPLAGDKKYLSRHKLEMHMTVGKELYQCTKTFLKRTKNVFNDWIRRLKKYYYLASDGDNQLFLTLLSWLPIAMV